MAEARRDPAGGPRRMVFGDGAEMTADTAHRPWPPPRRPWLLAQAWRDLLFAHWPVPAEAQTAANTMAAASGIHLPQRPPLLYFARRLDVIGWAPKVMRT